MDRARRVRDAEVVEDDLRRVAGDDGHFVNGHPAAEMRLQRLLDAQAHEVREGRRSEAPPAPANDECEQAEDYDHGDRHPPHEGPHRPATLALARRLVAVPFGLWLSRFHSDALGTC